MHCLPRLCTLLSRVKTAQQVEVCMTEQTAAGQQESYLDLEPLSQLHLATLCTHHHVSNITDQLVCQLLAVPTGRCQTSEQPWTPLSFWPCWVTKLMLNGQASSFLQHVGKSQPVPAGNALFTREYIDNNRSNLLQTCFCCDNQPKDIRPQSACHIACTLLGTH